MVFHCLVNCFWRKPMTVQRHVIRTIMDLKVGWKVLHKRKKQFRNKIRSNVNKIHLALAHWGIGWEYWEVLEMFTAVVDCIDCYRGWKVVPVVDRKIKFHLPNCNITFHTTYWCLPWKNSCVRYTFWNTLYYNKSIQIKFSPSPSISLKLFVQIS